MAAAADDEKAQLSSAGFEASAAALDGLTTGTTTDHGVQPTQTLHRPASHASSYEWLASHFPTAHLQKLEAGWHMGNYIIDRRTGAKSFEPMSIYVRVGMHLLYYGSGQEKALHWRRTVELLEKQTRKMGAAYDEPASREHIAPFIESFGLADGLKELEQPDPTQYPNFNAFFARALRPDARPIADPTDPLVVSSPADCRLTAFPTVDLATKYWIKGTGFTLRSLLGGDDDVAARFAGGSIVIARLAPQDYHRWHAPVAGVVERVTDIPGAYYTVNPQAINESGTLDVFCENRRSVMLLRRAPTGASVAVVAVGAMLVGSIVYDDGAAAPGCDVRRGQCLGSFLYGGSTVIVVFPKGELVLDDDLVRNSTEQGCETLVRVGWRVGAGPA